MTLVGLGRRCDDGLGEALVLAHAFRQFHAAELATSVLVFSPGAAGEIAANDHLHTEAFSLEAHCDHRVGRCQLPVGHDVGGGVKERGGNLIEHLTLERNALRQDDIEGGDAIGGNHHHEVVVDVVHVTNFAVINALLTGQREISFCQCFHMLQQFLLRVYGERCRSCSFSRSRHPRPLQGYPALPPDRSARLSADPPERDRP